MIPLMQLADDGAAIVAAVSTVIVGKDAALQLLLTGLLANGHILIEDAPGVAKTLMARLFAQVMGLQFRRVQFTPDLLPGDLTGGFLYNQQTADFEFRPGPVFTNVLLADEINRATPKTQAALLEAMQEQQVSIEGQTFPLPRPFVVLATQNPIDFEGTYPLPEAQLDRFLLRLRVGYPNPEEEWEILLRRQRRQGDAVRLTPVVEAETLVALQHGVEAVHVSEAVGRYMIDIVTATRRDSRVQVGVSPRGTLALFKLARAYAALQGRDFVTPDDVKLLALPALAHRLLLHPEMWARQVSEDAVLADLLQHVPAPKAE